MFRPRLISLYRSSKSPSSIWSIITSKMKNIIPCAYTPTKIAAYAYETYKSISFRVVQVCLNIVQKKTLHAVCRMQRQDCRLNPCSIGPLFGRNAMQLCIVRCVFYITNEMQLIQCSLLLSALYMFRAVFPPIIRSL